MCHRNSGGFANVLRYWWQAHVYVEEAQTVQDWYGFEASVEKWRQMQPQPDGQFWAHKERKLPRWATAQ